MRKFQLAEITRITTFRFYFLFELQKFLDLQTNLKNGLLAEWLGSGLQNRVRRFESARDLKKSLYKRNFYKGFLFFRVLKFPFSDIC